MEINIIRCLLILLIILIHCTPFKDAYPDAQSAVLGFSVPLFLFVTGYLFNVRKTGTQFAKYLRCMLTIYILFETAYAVMSYFLPVRDGISELSVGVVMDKLLLRPIGPYWYLHTMIVCGSIYYSMHRLCRKLGNDYAVTLSVLLSLVLSYFTPVLGLMAPLAYFAGVTARNRCGEFCGLFKGSPVAIPVAILTLVYGIAVNPEYGGQLTLFCIVMGISTIESLVWCSRKMPLSVCRYADLIGANTLPIYLFHPIFTMLSKKLLQDMIDNGNIFCFCLLTIISATAGSMLIGYAMDKVGVSKFLFGRNMMRTTNKTIIKGK